MERFLSLFTLGIGAAESGELPSCRRADVLAIGVPATRKARLGFQTAGSARPSGRRVPVDRAKEVERPYLLKDAGFSRSYTRTKLRR
jgi:hypothetical protein